MTKITCPHCKNSISEHKTRLFWKKDGDVHFCNFCSEPSIVIQGQSDLRLPTQKEEEKLNENDIDNPDWLPKIDRNDLTFDIVTIKNGCINPDEYNDVNFHEAQRILKLQFHEFGVIPLVGDIVEGNYTPNKENDFVIVSRQMGVDDYDTMILIVVEYSRWIQNMGW